MAGEARFGGKRLKYSALRLTHREFCRRKQCTPFITARVRQFMKSAEKCFSPNCPVKAKNCYFCWKGEGRRNCTRTSQPGCAVRFIHDFVQTKRTLLPASPHLIVPDNTTGPPPRIACFILMLRKEAGRNIARRRRRRRPCIALTNARARDSHVNNHDMTAAAAAAIL